MPRNTNQQHDPYGNDIESPLSPEIEALVRAEEEAELESKRTRNVRLFLNNETRSIVSFLANRSGYTDKQMIDQMILFWITGGKPTQSLSNDVLDEGLTWANSTLEKPSARRSYKAENQELLSELAELKAKLRAAGIE